MRTNFQMEYQDITMIRGDTLAFNVEVKDQNGNFVMITDANMTCKKRLSSDENIFHKALGSGITQDEDGLIYVRVAPQDTKEVDAGRYFYDFNIGVGNDVYTLMIGVLSIEQDVTF